MDVTVTLLFPITWQMSVRLNRIELQMCKNQYNYIHAIVSDKKFVITKPSAPPKGGCNLLKAKERTFHERSFPKPEIKSKNRHNEDKTSI